MPDHDTVFTHLPVEQHHCEDTAHHREHPAQPHNHSMARQLSRACWRAVKDASSHELSPAAWRCLFAAQRPPSTHHHHPWARLLHTSPPTAADSATNAAQEPAPADTAAPEIAPDHTSEEDPLQFATPRVKQLAEEIALLNIIELVDLTEILRRRFKVSEFVYQAGQPGLPAAPGAAAAAPAEEEVAAPVPAAEKTAFDIKVESYDAAGKIKVIKEVRGITGLGLKESKELVEGLPGVVKKGVPKEEAEKFKAQLEAAGAKVVLE